MEVFPGGIGRHLELFFGTVPHSQSAPHLLSAPSFPLAPHRSCVDWLTSLAYVPGKSIKRSFPHTTALASPPQNCCLWHFLHAQTESVCMSSASSYQSVYSGLQSCCWELWILQISIGLAGIFLAFIYWTQMSHFACSPCLCGISGRKISVEVLHLSNSLSWQSTGSEMLDQFSGSRFKKWSSV